MGPTRTRDLVGAAGLAAVAAYVVLIGMYRWFPPITVWTGLSLLVFAAGETGWAFYVRSKIADGEIGDSTGRLHPLAVAKSVVVAKASAWVGTAAFGWWIGVVAYLVPRRAELQVASNDTAGAVVAGISALALVMAALWLQHCCKSPDDPPDDLDNAMD
jgi:Protein of unknown function (DUF3180)